MRTKRLGRDGPDISVIGFGAWEVGIDLGDEALEQSLRAMQIGFDRGMTWVDTADVYGSEPIVGKAVVNRPEILVFTKAYHGRYQGGLTPTNLRLAAEASIRQIGREVIDLYLVLEPDPIIPAEDVWFSMVSLVDSGLARYIGLSNHTIDQLQQCELLRHVDAVEDRCSLVHREKHAALADFCEGNGTSFVAYGPLGLGVLTGAVSERTPIHDTSWGSDRSEKTMSAYQRSMFGGDVLPGHMRFAERLRPIASRTEISMAQLALAWVVGRDQFTVAIAGSTKPDNTKQNAEAGALELDGALLNELTALSS